MLLLLRQIDGLIEKEWKILLFYIVVKVVVKLFFFYKEEKVEFIW